MTEQTAGVLARLISQLKPPAGRTEILTYDNWTVTLKTAAPVPEPSSLLLAGLGSLGLVGYRWRRPSRRSEGSQ